MIDTIQTMADSVSVVLDTAPVVVDPESNFFLDHWVELLFAAMAFAKVVVNLTPTETDNKVFGWVDTLIGAIVPDRRKSK